MFYFDQEVATYSLKKNCTGSYGKEEPVFSCCSTFIETKAEMLYFKTCDELAFSFLRTMTFVIVFLFPFKSHQRICPSIQRTCTRPQVHIINSLFSSPRSHDCLLHKLLIIRYQLPWLPPNSTQSLYKFVLYTETNMLLLKNGILFKS